MNRPKTYPRYPSSTWIAMGQGAVERPILAKAHAESAKFRASKLDKCCEHCASAGQIVEEGNVVRGESANRKSMKPMFLFIKYGVNHGCFTSNMELKMVSCPQMWN